MYFQRDEIGLWQNLGFVSPSEAYAWISFPFPVSGIDQIYRLKIYNPINMGDDHILIRWIFPYSDLPVTANLKVNLGTEPLLIDWAIPKPLSRLNRYAQVLRVARKTNLLECDWSLQLELLINNEESSAQASY